MAPEKISRLVLLGESISDAVVSFLTTPPPHPLRLNPAPTASLRNATGMMACALFNAADGFPDVQAKSFQYVYVSINSGLANCEFKEVAAGTYAVSVFHDENDNKKLDKNFVGVPLEGYGVSNNIRHMISAPEFKESSFQVNGEVDKNIKIRMGY